MKLPILIPDLGATHESMRISAWFAQAGEFLEIDAPVVELLVAGATCDVSAPCRGRLVAPLRPLDAVVLPGETVAYIDPIESLS